MPDKKIETVEELRQYIENHLRECIDSRARGVTPPKLYHEGYVRALWGILDKIDHERYMVFLDEIVKKYGDTI